MAQRQHREDDRTYEIERTVTHPLNRMTRFLLQGKLFFESSRFSTPLAQPKLSEKEVFRLIVRDSR